MLFQNVGYTDMLFIWNIYLKLGDSGKNQLLVLKCFYSVPDDFEYMNDYNNDDPIVKIEVFLIETVQSYLFIMVVLVFYVHF